MLRSTMTATSTFPPPTAPTNDCSVDAQVTPRSSAGVLQQNCPSSSYALYPQRWVVLVAMSFLNATNQILWLTFAPVADVAGVYLSAEATQVNSLSIVYLVAEAALCLPTVWLLEAKGLRTCLVAGAWLNACGSVVRAVGCQDFVPEAFRFPVCLTGQALAACAEGVPLFGVTKLASTWFPEGQRGVVSSVVAMSNPLGILLAYVIVPLAVRSPADLPTLLVALTAPSVVTAVATSVGVRSGAPPTPPSASSSREMPTFSDSLKQVARNRRFWVLFFSTGIGTGLYTALFTLLQLQLCHRGYDNYFSGLCGALMMACGIVGALLAGILVDRTKRCEEIAKTTYALAVVGIAAYFIVSRYSEQKALVAIALGVSGFFGLAAYPILLVLAAEVTYPAAEAASCGLVVVSGGLQGTLLVLVAQWLAQPTSNGTANLACQSSTSYDFTYSNITLESLLSFAALVLIVCLRPKDKKLTNKKEAAALPSSKICGDIVAKTHAQLALTAPKDQQPHLTGAVCGNLGSCAKPNFIVPEIIQCTKL